MSDGSADVVERLTRVLEHSPVPGLVSAYVFGSVVERREHRGSDVDVAILLDRQVHPDDRARFEAQVQLRRYLSPATVGREVDLLVLNDVSPAFGRRIVASGARVICHDLEADHRFRRDVQLRAADLEPFLQRMRRLLHASLAR